VYGTPRGGQGLSQFPTQETTVSGDGSTATTRTIDGDGEFDIVDVRGLLNRLRAQGNADLEDPSELSDDEFTSLLTE